MVVTEDDVEHVSEEESLGTFALTLKAQRRRGGGGGGGVAAAVGESGGGGAVIVVVVDVGIVA